MKNNVFKKIDANNVKVNILYDTVKCNDPLCRYYHYPAYSVEVELKDKESDKLIDTFTFDFRENGMDDDDGYNWRYAVGDYINNEDITNDPDLWNDEEDEYEADVIYNSWSAKNQAKFNKWYEKSIATMNEESMGDNWDFFERYVTPEILIAYWLDDSITEKMSDWTYWEWEKDGIRTSTNVVKFYSIGVNGTVILYDVEDADWNDIGDKILVGKNIKRVFNINEEAFLQKQGNTVFSVNYSGNIDYYEKEKDVEEPDYLEVGETFGFYANKNNCGFFVEAK